VFLAAAPEILVCGILIIHFLLYPAAT